MTALALGRRQLVAHPSPYRGLTCASTHVRAHVHDQHGNVLYAMPDGCAACGRQWFSEDEHTIMGYCGDCWPGNAFVLDITDDTEAVPATYPQPVRHRAQPARGQACAACVAMQAKYGQASAACAQHRTRFYPDVGAAFDRLVDARDRGENLTVDEVAEMFAGGTASTKPLICPGCGHLADLRHSPLCPQAA